MSPDAGPSLLRDHQGETKVSYVELFFDLVYVFAITQLSHFLQHHLNPTGFIEGLELFLAVWWAWIFTSWATNWADPDRVPVRLLLMVLMLLSLVMTISIPGAFGSGGVVFAGSYVALQLGRSLAMIAIFGANAAGARNMARISVWFAAGGVFWLIGAFADPHARLAWWGAALAIEYAGPACLFAVPGLGRSRAGEWDISGAHLAERAALFIIIALGEGIVVAGATVSGAGLSWGLAFALLLAFAGSVVMWWLYFDVGAERGSRRIEQHAQPGAMARSAYTYLHMPIVGGVIISAVADALLLAEWRGSATPALVLMQCGGLIVYLAGIGVFKRFSNARGNFPLSHIAGLVLLGCLAITGWLVILPAMAVFGAAVGVLVLVAAWEWRSFHGGWIDPANRAASGRHHLHSASRQLGQS